MPRKRALEALDLVAGLRLEDGRLWGDAAYPFQWEDVRAILQSSGPPFHFLTRARGASKTTDLSAVAIAALLTERDRARMYWLAADQGQGQLAIDAVGGFVTRTPLLQGQVDIQSKRVVVPSTGSSLEVLAADAPSVWGLNPSAVFVDELAQWAATQGPRRLWEGVSSAVAKRADAKLVVLTTAGDPAHWSRTVLDHALEDPLWRVHEVPGPAPWMAPDRIDEQRRRLPESSFHRLFLNEWTADEDRLTNVDDLAACVILDGPQPPRPHVRYVLGVDLGIRKDRSVAALCHLERADGRPIHEQGDAAARSTTLLAGTHVALDRMEVWVGTKENPVRLSDVEAWIEQAVSAYNNAVVVIDPWQAIGLGQRLRARGVRVKEFGFSSASVGRLASTLHQLLRNHSLALPDDPELLNELANIRLRESTPGVYRLDHDAGQHDDRAIALGIAADELLSRPVVYPAERVRQFGQRF